MVSNKMNHVYTVKTQKAKTLVVLCIVELKKHGQ